MHCMASFPGNQMIQYVLLDFLKYIFTFIKYIYPIVRKLAGV